MNTRRCGCALGPHLHRRRQTEIFMCEHCAAHIRSRNFGGATARCESRLVRPVNTSKAIEDLPKPCGFGRQWSGKFRESLPPRARLLGCHGILGERRTRPTTFHDCRPSWAGSSEILGPGGPGPVSGTRGCGTPSVAILEREIPRIVAPFALNRMTTQGGSRLLG